MRPAIIFYNNNGNPLSVGSRNTPEFGLLGHSSNGANASVLEVVGGAVRQGWSLPLTELIIVQEPAIIETTCQSQNGPFISGYYLTLVITKWSRFNVY